MSNHTWGILLGGIIPAVCLGVFAIFQKMSARANTSPGIFLIVVGITVCAFGVILTFCTGDKLQAGKELIYPVLCGLFWATAFGLIAYALTRFNMPISKLSPLYNTNTLITVVLSLIILSEWQEVNVTRLIIASVLIVAGGILVNLR